MDTKAAPRRDLRYESFDDLAADLDAIEAAHRAGTLGVTGNWTPGQIMDHLAKFATCALDGFPGRAPWPIRKLLTVMYKKKILSGDPLPPGYKIPKQAAFMRPREDITTEEGIAELRGIIDRLRAGEQFSQPSPIFENLTHEQWCKAQLGHASMHMSFISVGG